MAKVKFNTVSVRVAGKGGKWSVVDSKIMEERLVFLMKHDTPRVKKMALVVDEDMNILSEDCYSLSEYRDMRFIYRRYKAWGFSEEEIEAGVASEYEESLWNDHAAKAMDSYPW